MTALELTEHALRRILAELRPEIEALEVIAARIARAAGPLPEPGSDAGARAYLAVELHRYYTALESALERLLRTLDRFVPAGETWHRELLRLASLPLPEVRPALLDPATAGELSHLLSFRHFFRHAYAVELDWGHLEAHRRRVEAVHPQVRAGLVGIADHLAASLAALPGLAVARDGDDGSDG